MKQFPHWANLLAAAVNEAFFYVYEINLQFLPRSDMDRLVKIIDWLKRFEGTILHSPIQPTEFQVRFRIMADKVDSFKHQMVLVTASKPKGTLEVQLNTISLNHLIDKVILSVWNMLDFATHNSHHFEDQDHMVYTLYCLRAILELECPIIHNLTVEILEVSRFVTSFGILHLRVSQIVNKLNNNYQHNATPCFITLATDKQIERPQIHNKHPGRQ